MAYAGLADSYAVFNWYGDPSPKDAYPRAQAAALKALEIDETLGEAHAALGLIRHEYNWDQLAAEKEYQQAIQLSPSYATAHQWYAEYLTRMGRYDEALAEMTRAQELDPLSLIVNTVAGWVLLFAGRLDEAVEQLQEVIEMDPNFVLAHTHLGRVYMSKGMLPEAIVEYRMALTLSESNTRNLSDLGLVHAVAGEETEAREVLDELRERWKRGRGAAIHIATIYILLGENEQGIQWLEEAYNEPGLLMTFLKTSSLYDPLRDDPRFQSLLRRMNFPE